MSEETLVTLDKHTQVCRNFETWLMENLRPMEAELKKKSTWEQKLSNSRGQVTIAYLFQVRENLKLYGRIVTLTM